jgi:hypothetical protein
MKLGIITSWNRGRGCGTIVSGNNERYFLWSSKVISGPEPDFNYTVQFDIDPRPVKLGRLPFACNVTVLGTGLDAMTNAGAADAFSGNERQDGGQ